MIGVYFLAALLGSAAFGAVSGEDVYKQRCAGCHDQANTRVPYRETLRQLPAARILRTLNWGVMGTVAYTMTLAEREAVASYLGSANEPPISAQGYCSDRSVQLADKPRFQWNGWSPGADNARQQSAEAAGLTLDGVRHLKLKWAFGYDGDTTAFAQPTVVDGNLFTGSAGGVVYALDARRGCIRWTYEARGPVRSSILVVRNVLLFGDQLGWFYALDATTGRELWKKRVDEHDATRLTGAPMANDGIVYVPIASWEENRALSASYACCTFRGSVLALRIRDGSQVWRTYMVGVPKRTGKDSWGPSGAPIWTAPTLDLERGLLYVTTGDNYSAPATSLSDSVLGLNLKSGRIAWSRQFIGGDIFNGRCSTNPDGCGPDYDFASSPILIHAKGRRLLLAGQKSGVVYALDPDRKGEIVWQIKIGKGGTNGGIEWGMAADQQNVYAAVSDLVRLRPQNSDPIPDPKQGGGLTAIRIADGTKVWFADPHACDPPKLGCSPAQPAAVTVIPGVVFSGSVDGHMRAYAAEDGKLLWDFDTARMFETVNGVQGHGGSIDGPGTVVVNGLVYVNSGYARQNGMPGNVLLAFGAD